MRPKPPLPLPTASAFSLLLLLAAFIAFGEQIVYGSFIDARDGTKYITARLGGRTWMAENLNFKTKGSLCYDNDETNCRTYGRLYSWHDAMVACPAGWRLSTGEDWDSLVIFAGDSLAGGKLKAKEPAFDGSDTFIFTALPGGVAYSKPDGSFAFLGIGWVAGRWWTSKGHSDSTAYHRNMHMEDSPDICNGKCVLNEVSNKSGYYSVRCVKID